MTGAENGWQAWRDQPEPLDVASRLAALAAALPEAFPEREKLAARIRRLEGDSAAVEEALAGLDREMVQLALQALSADQRADLDGVVAQGLGEAASRLPPEDLEAERGPGLGCFRFQLVLLAVFIVLTPLSAAWHWPEWASALLLFATIILLLVAGQTIVFLLRLVAADRRSRRRPLASGSKTVGELEDESGDGQRPA